MNRRPWVRLDNASNIFLAARSDVDSKVFRISAEMDHDVDPALLRQALDTTFDRYPLYHAVIRSGVFWYYLQDSDLRPAPTVESLPSCAPIYQADRRTLLFRVLYYRRRIMLEIFHALSDGTGALWFLSDLVTEYVRLGSPGSVAVVHDTPLRIDEDRGAADTASQHPPAPLHELAPDSFGQYFRRQRGADRASTRRPLLDRLRGARRAAHPRVYRVRGTLTPDLRTRLVELTVPAGSVLALAREAGVSPTMYLTAMFFESLRLTAPAPDRVRAVAASVPVNLRQFFPSTSARNFFATVRVEHRYGAGDEPDTVESIARGLEQQFRPKASREALEQKLQRLLRFERMPVLRIVPRVLKNVLLSLINRGNNRGLTVAVSNLGRVTLPEPADARVERMMFHVSAARPQFCAMSHGDRMTISFTSPFSETDHVREFARMLTERGVDVSVAATRVTETELAWERS